MYLIAKFVPCDFFVPELGTRRGDSEILATRVTVPEAAVNIDHRPILRILVETGHGFWLKLDTDSI